MDNLNKWRGDMLVCNKYRLAQVNGQFSEDHKILLRENAKITKDFYEQINANTIDSGVIYVIDSDATDNYYEQAAKQYKARIAAKNIGTQATQRLADAIQGIAQQTIPIGNTAEVESVPVKVEDTPKETTVPEGIPNETWEQPQVIKWLQDQKDKEGNPIQFKASLGIKRLINEVVTPYLESMKPEEGENSQNTNDKTES